MADLGISIEAMLQREPVAGEERVDVIMLTHRTIEKQIDQAIVKIEALDSIAGAITRIRLESLGTS